MGDREHFPDDIPVADAVDQQRGINDSDADDETYADSPREWPLEASDHDWQEQLDTVDLDPEEDRADG